MAALCAHQLSPLGSSQYNLMLICLSLLLGCEQVLGRCTALVMVFLRCLVHNKHENFASLCSVNEGVHSKVQAKLCLLLGPQC